jgi:hypothetical protein
MSIIVTDRGFGPDDWTAPIVALEDARPGVGIDLPASADPLELAGRLRDTPLIRVNFDSFADGRGFTIARRLRLMGYTGRLRAGGHVIGARALTRWKSAMTWPPASPRINGCSAPTGRGMTISRGCAADRPFT